MPPCWLHLGGQAGGRVSVQRKLLLLAVALVEDGQKVRVRKNADFAVSCRRKYLLAAPAEGDLVSLHVLLMG